MTRIHPVFSRWGCLGGLLLVAGVALAIAVSGGAIFSPGQLTAHADDVVPSMSLASHAEIGNDCAQCHAPFTGITAERCQVCHVGIADERTAGSGLHGALPAAQARRCDGCHTDHQGRDFDPSAAALQQFDHNLVGFTLARHLADFVGSPITCHDCHSSGDYQSEPAACAACHGQAEAAFMEQHLAAFGARCLDCHDGSDSASGFDHSSTDFPLDGRHATLECAACHNPAVAPAETENQCAGCHAEPPLHAGLFGTDCAGCHTATAWQPATLPDHRFPLDHGGAGLIPCATCHTESFAVYTCTNCHEHEPADIIEEHAEEGIVGEALLLCAACHPNGEKD